MKFSKEDLELWIPIFGVVILIAVIWVNVTIQSNSIKTLCLKSFKTELKNDPEIQDICKDVKITLGEMNGY